MPNEDKQTVTNNQQPVASTPPPVLEDVVTPPIVPNIKPSDDNQKQNSDSGSAAPSNDVLMPTTTISSMPRKKFAGGKVIATILGLFLLVGGLGAGVYLTQQNQNPQEKAAGCDNILIAKGTAQGDGIGNTYLCPATLDPGKSCDPRTGGVETNITENSCFCGILQIDHADGTYESYKGGECQSSEIACRSMTVNCPTGSSVDYNQPTSKDCFNVHDQGKWCSGPGSAQKQTGCCVTQQTDSETGEVYCTNPEYTTYNCCPTGTSSQCTTTYSEYSSSPESGGCGNDTELSRVQHACYLTTNDKGHWVNVCPIEILCKKATTSCVCGGTPPPFVTPSPAPITAICQNIKAYSTNNWTLLNSSVLSTLRSGQDSVYFCVTGSATGGSFDKAKFTINGTDQAETTIKRPGSEDFCQLYNLPTETVNYNVTAQIHHVTLGWK